MQDMSKHIAPPVGKRQTLPLLSSFPENVQSTGWHRRARPCVVPDSFATTQVSREQYQCVTHMILRFQIVRTGKTNSGRHVVM